MSNAEAHNWDRHHWTVGHNVYQDGELIGTILAVDERDEGATLKLGPDHTEQSADVEVRR